MEEYKLKTTYVEQEGGIELTWREPRANPSKAFCEENRVFDKGDVCKWVQNGGPWLL